MTPLICKKCGENFEPASTACEIICPYCGTITASLSQLVNEGTTDDPLLRRAFLLLEDGQWKNADEYFERALDNSPESAFAYLGKMMAELHVNTPDNLTELKTSFASNKNYQKTVRFADIEVKTILASTLTCINEYNKRTAELNAQKRKEKANKIKKLSVIIIPIACFVLLLTCLFNAFVVPKIKYNSAISYLERGNYIKAYTLFCETRGHYNSEKYISHFKFLPTKIIFTNYDGSTTESIYDDKGNLIKKIYTDPYQNVNTTKYVYDAKGNLLKTVTTNSNGDMSTSEYIYNAIGSLLKVIVTNADGTVRTLSAAKTASDDTLIEYVYAENGNVIKEIHTSPYNGVSTVEYNYNSKGNITKEIHINPYNVVSTIEYYYDNKGNITKEIYTCQDYVKITKNEYDRKGNLLKKIATDAQGEIICLDEYFYDENGILINEKHTQVNDLETLIYEYAYFDTRVIYEP